MNASRISSKWSLFGAGWRHRSDGFVVSWPTIPFVLHLVGISFAIGIGAGFKSASGGAAAWRGIAVGGGITGVLLTLLCGIFRERLSLNEREIRCTRWPAILRSSTSAQRSSVRGAVIEQDIPDETRMGHRIGRVSVRVRIDGETEWWSVGGTMSWRQARRLGQQFAQYMRVREETV